MSKALHLHRSIAFRRRLMWLIIAAMGALIIWAYFAELDEVAVGDSKVVPYSRSMVIQTLDPGVLKELKVREGDVVEKGQHLATLDPVQAESAVGEAEARIDTLRGQIARLQAEMTGGGNLSAPDGAPISEATQARELAALRTNRDAYRQSVASLEHELKLARQELNTVEPHLATGAANPLEVLKIRQRIADIETRLSATRHQYMVGLREEFSKANSELQPLVEVRTSRVSQLERTVISAPAKGVVNDVRLTTLGGVLSAGGVLMEIVPLGDNLLIEAKITPRDIAFVHPGQEANVKITAYDSSIYGNLTGVVERVSADSLTDETDKRIQYYRVYVRTNRAYMQTKDGKRWPIVPGMVAATEIKTGHRTVMQYLLKPLNKAKEAMRER